MQQTKPVESVKWFCLNCTMPNPGSSPSTSSTAVGFDERMLLHSEAFFLEDAFLSMQGKSLNKNSRCYFTSDTYANEYSARAARFAAGLCADLAKEIFSGRVKNGFALVRPPGHHAGIKDAMGFCLHNNAAVAALVAQAAGARKVLIVDWDVHHGNGTQEIFEKTNLYCTFPCTDMKGESFIRVLELLMRLVQMALKVTPAGYSRMTQMLGDLCGGKMLVILEGGYNLRSISSSATAVIKVLLGENAENDLPIATTPPSRACLRTVLEVMKIQMKFWPSLATSYSKLLSEWEASRPEKRAEPRREAVVTQGDVDAEAVVVDEEAPSEFAFNFSYSGDGSLLDDKEACGELFRLKSRTDYVAREKMYNEVVVKSASRFQKMRSRLY
ncbi:unnamed protein product [Brassica rapa subsp. trilocularis]